MSEFRVIFVADDYDATLAFFTDVMGLEMVRSFEDGGRGCIFSAADGQIEIFDSGDETAAPVSGARLAWEVDDADAEHDRLVASGAEITRPPELQPWGHRNFEIQGPDGWTIILFQIVVAQ